MEALRGAPATLRFPEHGGDPVELSEPTVTITRDSDGEAVVEGAETTKGEEGGETFWTVELTGAQIPEVDVLKVVWSDESASYTTHVEVVGGFVVSLAAIEAKLGEKAAEELRVQKREIALREIERACGVAFRPRYAKELLDGTGSKRLLLPRREVTEVLAVEVGGTALSTEEVEALTLEPIGVVIRAAGWPSGKSNVSITYVHGYDYFPPAETPVRDYAAYLLADRPSDYSERATQVSTDVATYSLVTPGMRGAQFPLPTVNAFVEQYMVPLVR